MFSFEYSNYKIKFDKIKMRLLKHVKQFIFRDFLIKISLFILKIMLFYYKIIIDHNIKSYIKQFIATINFACSYLIKQSITKKLKY